MSSRCYFDKQLLKQKQESLDNAETISDFLNRGGTIVKVCKNKSGLSKTKKQSNKVNGLKLLQAAKGTIHEKQVIKLLKAKGIKL